MTADQQTNHGRNMWPGSGPAAAQRQVPPSLGQRYAYQQPSYQPPPPSRGYAPPPAYSAELAPGVGPVIAFTLIFGAFGAISAGNRAARAKAMGLPTRPYWAAFNWTFGLSALASVLISLVFFFGLLGFLAAIPPAAEDSGSAGTVSVSWLEESIVSQGEFTDAEGAALSPTQATCAGVNVGDTGAGTYKCMIDFADGSRRTVEVISDSSGRWVAN